MKLNVLISKGNFPDRTGYVAHALEYDIMAEGRSVEDSANNLSRLVAGTILLRENGLMRPMSEVETAPELYWQAYEKAEPIQRELPGFESECRLVI